MTFYHYSTTYTGGDKLINDYNHRYKDAEPFILALETSMDVFRSTYYAAMYLERQFKEQNIRRYEMCQKDAAEAIFEFARRTYYPNEVSRLNCVYYCRSREEAIACAMEDWIDCGDKTKEEVKILALEVDDSRIGEYDQEYFNLAYDAVSECRFEDAIEYAKQYYAKEATEKPIWEILADGENRVVEEIEY